MKALATPLVLFLVALISSAVWAEEPVINDTGWETANVNVARPTAKADMAANGGFASGQVLVKVRAGARGIQSEELTRSVSGVRIAIDEPLGWEVWSVQEGTELDSVNTLRSNGQVQYAEPNYYKYHYAIPNDTYYDWQGYLPDINLEEAWGISTGSSTVKVAIVDSGISSSHSDLTGKLLTGKNIADEGLSTNDYNGHGTFIAGIIGASSNNGAGIAGVSWGAKLMPVKVEDILRACDSLAKGWPGNGE